MNLRQVKQKTKSISNVKKITKALQLVSAVKMKRAQQAAVEGAPYREGLEKSLRRISGGIESAVSPLLMKPADTSKKHLMIYVSSNKGMCGAFHLNLYRYITKNVNLKDTDVIAVGKKGATFIAQMGGKLVADFSSNHPLNEASAVFGMALEKFLSGEYKSVSILYNKFISTLRSEQMNDTLLPMSMPVTNEGDDHFSGEYLVEPAPEEIMDSLLRSYLEEKIRGAIMSSEAVEHSMRMMAMKNATDNANELIYSLTLLGNKLRQTKITMELLDMITAKESVES